MIEPWHGPFLFNTSAESWLARTAQPNAIEWWRNYLQSHPVHVSSVTVLERVRGYAMLWRTADQNRKPMIESARLAYLRTPREVVPLDSAVALVSAEILALLPAPPSPARRSHQLAESKAERSARWRFDAIVAATGMVTAMPLIHNNPADFEAIRSAVETNPQRFPKMSLNLVRCANLGVS